MKGAREHALFAAACSAALLGALEAEAFSLGSQASSMAVRLASTGLSLAGSEFSAASLASPFHRVSAGASSAKALFAKAEGGEAREASSEECGLALASFLRCHKSLLNDRDDSMADGNLCMLLRGCDAHQRLISPLEIQTNAHSLPGAEAAMVMAQKGPEALKRLCSDTPATDVSEEGSHRMCRAKLLNLEVDKMHRVLQYAVAAGVSSGFLSQTALRAVLELYQEAGLDLSEVTDVLTRLRSFYEKEMPPELFQAYAQAHAHLLSQLAKAQKEVKVEEEVDVKTLPFEPEPDPRTLTPLHVDILSYKDRLRKTACSTPRQTPLRL